MGHGECSNYTMKENVIKWSRKGQGKIEQTQTITISEKCNCPGFVCPGFVEHFGSKIKHPCLWCGHDFRSHKT